MAVVSSGSPKSCARCEPEGAAVGAAAIDSRRTAPSPSPSTSAATSTVRTPVGSRPPSNPLDSAGGGSAVGVAAACTSSAPEFRMASTSAKGSSPVRSTPRLRRREVVRGGVGGRGATEPSFGSGSAGTVRKSVGISIRRSSSHHPRGADMASACRRQTTPERISATSSGSTASSHTTEASESNPYATDAGAEQLGRSHRRDTPGKLDLRQTFGMISAASESGRPTS